MSYRNLLSLALLLTLTWMLSGCATFGSSSEVIMVHSKPEGAEVIYHGQSLGQTPLLVKVPRASHQDIELKLGEETTNLHLNGSYRWGRSFAGNLLFFGWAPVGWLVDLASGRSWSFRRDNTVEFSAKQAQPDNQREKSIAIAPPLSDHPNISDEAGQLLNSVKKDFLVYKKTLPTFENYDIDFDSSGDERNNYNLYYDLGVSRIYFNQVETTGETSSEAAQKSIKIHGQIQNVYDPSHPEKLDFDFSRDKLKSVDEFGWYEHRSIWNTWFPNTAFLDASGTQTSFDINGVKTTASAKSTNDFWGEASSVISTLSFRQVFPPSQRDEWRYTFRLVPSLGFSYANESFSNIPILAGEKFTTIHGDVGWGPSFNYGNPHWDFYFNVYPILEYNSISTSANGEHYSAERASLDVGTEFGILYFFKSHWVIRTYTRSAEVPNGLWQNILERSTQQPVVLTNSSVISTGIAIGYTFANKDLPF